MILDTPKEILDKQREIIHSKTGRERAMMGAKMIDDNYQLVHNIIKRQNPQASKQELIALLFERYYGKEFDKVAKEEIIKGIIEFEPNQN